LIEILSGKEKTMKKIILLFFIVLFLVEAQENMNISLQARWISKNTILWTPSKSIENNTVSLYFHEKAQMYTEGTEKFTLPYKGLADDNTETTLPYLSFLYGRHSWDTSFFTPEQIERFIKGQLFLVLHDKENNILETTPIQLAGILDDVYAYDGYLGLQFIRNRPLFRLWAPTAKSVYLHLYKTATAESEYDDTPIAMEPLLTYTFDGEPSWTGVWEYRGPAHWKNSYYLYNVEVYVPSTGKIEHNLVTDPYSVSLSINSQRSHVLDLNDPTYMPEGWEDIPYPSQKYPNAIYELHVRDFSIQDQSIPKQVRGTYLAFTHKNSHGMKHLAELAHAGLTHVHLLPTFDIATIEEDRTKQLEVKLQEKYEPDSEEPQAKIALYKDKSGFNWGYDPLHYMTPEGSYATQPNNGERILEFRKMIQSLHQINLGTILDVVFNHTNAAGQNNHSILDKIVPNYYYRLDDHGNVPHSSCCPDTASEHRMMEKLMMDTLTVWAVHYKVAGFRFDLMGHHTKENMQNIREMLNNLLPDDKGENIFIYGEAWKFGSLNAMLPQSACHQENTFGLGIGTFNDRMRDSVRGGNPFADLAAQGYATGLYYDYNKDPENREIPDDLEKQKQILNQYTDIIRVSLAGNLRDFSFTDCQGNITTGKQIQYRGHNAGYAADPIETINYVSVHDNHTLWDAIQAKAPFRTKNRNPHTATIEERVSMQKLALSLVAFGQGIPIFHAGCELLRSKSGDTDSYNSGDYFNALDYTYQSTNWGKGLPSAEKNRYAWDFWKPRLQDPSIVPVEQHIRDIKNYFVDLLRIRKTSPLLHLQTSKQVQQKIQFLNAEQGKEQIPGLIVLLIQDHEEPFIDKENDQMLFVFYCGTQPIQFQHKALGNIHWVLHPALQKHTNAPPKIQSTLTIPARSVLLYQHKRTE